MPLCGVYNTKIIFVRKYYTYMEEMMQVFHKKFRKQFYPKQGCDTMKKDEERSQKDVAEGPCNAAECYKYETA